MRRKFCTPLGVVCGEGEWGHGSGRAGCAQLVLFLFCAVSRNARAWAASPPKEWRGAASPEKHAAQSLGEICRGQCGSWRRNLIQIYHDKKRFLLQRNICRGLEQNPGTALVWVDCVRSERCALLQLETAVTVTLGVGSTSARTARRRNCTGGTKVVAGFCFCVGCRGIGRPEA